MGMILSCGCIIWTGQLMVRYIISVIVLMYRVRCVMKMGGKKSNNSQIWEKRQENAKNDELSLETQIELLRQENEQLKAILQQLLESIKKE